MPSLADMDARAKKKPLDQPGGKLMQSTTHHVDTRTLTVEYRRWGNAEGRPVILLHG